MGGLASQFGGTSTVTGITTTNSTSSTYTNDINVVTDGTLTINQAIDAAWHDRPGGNRRGDPRPRNRRGHLGHLRTASYRRCGNAKRPAGVITGEALSVLATGGNIDLENQNDLVGPDGAAGVFAASASQSNASVLLLQHRQLGRVDGRLGPA